MQLPKCINLSLLFLLKHTSPHLEGTQSSCCHFIAPKPNTDNGTPHNLCLPGDGISTTRPAKHTLFRTSSAFYNSSPPLSPLSSSPSASPRSSVLPAAPHALTVPSKAFSPPQSSTSRRHAPTTWHSRHQLQLPTHASHHPRYPLRGSIHCCCCLGQSKTSWK